MKKHQLQTEFLIYADESELPAADRQLLHLAKETLPQAYAPYSNFQVAAAVRLQNDATVAGCNQENAAYPMCLCAERVALSAAASQYPNEAIETIAITVRNPEQLIDQPAAPCGSCRQAMVETEYRYQQKVKVILQGERGAVYVFNSAKDLLPLAFDGSFL